jgi:hypothetical protein
MPMRASHRPARFQSYAGLALAATAASCYTPRMKRELATSVCSPAGLSRTPAQAQGVTGQYLGCQAVKLAVIRVQGCQEGAPEGWCVTPRKAEVPREKPWLWRRTAMISSSSEMLSMHSVRSAYLYGIR